MAALRRTSTGRVHVVPRALRHTVNHLTPASVYELETSTIRIKLGLARVVQYGGVVVYTGIRIVVSPALSVLPSGYH